MWKIRSEIHAQFFIRYSFQLNVNCETKSTDESGNKMQSWRENFDPKFCAILASLYFNETIEKEPTDKDEKQEVACTYSHADSGSVASKSRR